MPASPVRCTCGILAFVIDGGMVELRAKHHGETHIVRRSLADLVRISVGHLDTTAPMGHNVPHGAN